MPRTGCGSEAGGSGADIVGRCRQGSGCTSYGNPAGSPRPRVEQRYDVYEQGGHLSAQRRSGASYHLCQSLQMIAEHLKVRPKLPTTLLVVIKLVVASY